MLKTRWRRVVPIGISTSPELLTLPVSAITIVPEASSVPIEENHCAPFSKILGMKANVFTLFMFVGLFHNPETAGYGGRGLGVPRCPINEAINAVSSPQTKAPAPFII